MSTESALLLSAAVLLGAAAAASTVATFTLPTRDERADSYQIAAMNLGAAPTHSIDLVHTAPRLPFNFDQPTPAAEDDAVNLRDPKDASEIAW